MLEAIEQNFFGALLLGIFIFQMIKLIFNAVAGIETNTDEDEIDYYAELDYLILDGWQITITIFKRTEVKLTAQRNEEFITVIKPDTITAIEELLEILEDKE